MSIARFTNRWMPILGILLLIITPTFSQPVPPTPPIRVIVLDEFDIPENPDNPTLLPAEYYDELEGQLCAVTPESLVGQGNLGVQRTMGETPTTISHGEVVLGTVVADLITMGITNYTIEDIDIFNFDSTTLDDIANLIEALVEGTDTPTIINMSFAFVPCELLWDFERARRNMQPGDELSPSVLQDRQYMIEDLFNNPPQTTAISDIVTNYSHVILVASAGNFPVPFPLYPARFDGVIGVGASDEAVIGLDGFLYDFNDGEISDISVWTAPHPTDPNLILEGHGTSFAAPRVVAKLVVYLLVEDEGELVYATRCEDGTIPLNFQDGVDVITWMNIDITSLSHEEYCFPPAMETAD